MSLRTSMLAMLVTFGYLAPMAQAQEYPSKPVRLVVPVAAGGPIDTIARLMAEQMQPHLGQPLVVENRTGAGGTLATKSVATADPDGYTIMLTTLQTFGIAPALYPDTVEDVAKLVPVGLVAEFPFVFVVPSQIPAKSVAEFVQFAKASKEPLSFGGSLATPAHLLGILFNQANGLDIAYVPYKGLAPSINDLISARTHMAFDAMGPLAPLIADGKLRLLAVLSPQRSPRFPDAPTMRESGFQNFPGNPWAGLVVPPGTPADVIGKLNAAINASLKAPKTLELMDKLSLVAIGGPPQDFAKRIAEDQPKWRETVRASGAKAE